MLIGLVLSILVFIWALRSGQFRDQKRARFLPLEPEPEVRRTRSTKRSRLEMAVLFALVCSGLIMSAVFVIVVLVRSR
jgi:nitrogen fixation-related uncharacterized protein